jgi:hypothetical protein
MEKRHILLMLFSTFSILLISLIANSSSVSAELVCGQPANSFLGFGQVNLSGIIHSCNNVADGVCPEDYQDASNSSIFGNCSSCLDPDCTGTIVGVVRDVYNTPIDRVLVKTNPIKWNQSAPPIENSVYTDVLGAYTLTAITGRYYVSASKSSYDTELKEVNVLRNQVVNLDFQLLNGTCHDDCTNSYGRCNANCQGQVFYNGSSSCNFYNSTITDLCNNRLLGTSVYISSYNSTHAYFVNCCEGIPYIKYYSSVSVNTNKIRDLAKIEKIAKYNDIPVKVIIAYWTPVDDK